MWIYVYSSVCFCVPRNIETRSHISCVKSVYCSGRRSKQRIQGQRIIFERWGPRGWNKNILPLYFPYWPASQYSCIRSNLISKLAFCWTVISHQSFSPFPSTCVGALAPGFVYIPPTVYAIHNMRISELSVPLYSSLIRSFYYNKFCMQLNKS